jgi:acetyltransferase-like isoleucine patch superfamily enzyme
MTHPRSWIARIWSRCSEIAQFWKNEAVEWFRAFLRAIPGETGCALRNYLYGFKVSAGARVLSHVIIYYPRRLRIGKNTGIAAYCQFHAGAGIHIGCDVLIGPNVMIWSQSHVYDDGTKLIRSQGWKRQPVAIEDDVWVGAGAIILPGVRLARGSVVAAGAVVTESTEPYSVVAGVPARQIKSRAT